MYGHYSQETENHSDESRYEIQRDEFILACDRIKKKALASLDAIILSEIAVDRHMINEADYIALFKSTLSLDDAFGDLSAETELVEATMLGDD